jgi:hypothetical protein
MDSPHSEIAARRRLVKRLFREGVLFDLSVIREICEQFPSATENDIRADLRLIRSGKLKEF